MENQTPLQNPAKPSPWGSYFKEFLMLFPAVILLNSIVFGQNTPPKNKPRENIQVYENKEKHTYTIKRGKKILWRKVKFAKVISDCYQILTRRNEKIFVDFSGGIKESPGPFRVCGTHLGNYNLTTYTLNDSTDWFSLVEQTKYYNSKKVSRTKIDSIFKKGITNIYFHNGQKRLLTSNSREFSFDPPLLEPALIVEKEKQKGIWFNRALDWFDDVFYRNGLFKVENKNGVGFYKVTPIHYYDISDFQYYLARFEMKDGKGGYVDTEGKEYFD